MWVTTIAAGLLSVSATAEAGDYKILKPSEVNCQLETGGRIEWGTDGLLNADKVELLCEGKQVDLVDGRIVKGWLATKSFGGIKFTSTGGFGMNIFVTDEQKNKLRKAFKKSP